MLYLNQLDHRHIHYEHNVDFGGVPEERRNVATSGCGLCSMCMVVDQLTTHQLGIEECVRLSYETQANFKVGTRMRRLGPYAAEKFGLTYSDSPRIEDLLTHLQSGGVAIVNVGGDHDDHVGIFSKSGHYIVACAYDGDELCILDPSFREGKYPETGPVRVSYPYLYCKPEVLLTDVQNREIPFYLFARKKPE